MVLLDFATLQAAEFGQTDWRNNPFLLGKGTEPISHRRREGLAEGIKPSYIAGAAIDTCDAILIRMMPLGTLEQVIFRMDVLQAAHNRGVVVMNPPRALETCIDKFLTTHRLAMAGVPTPRTWAGQLAADAMTAFTELGRDAVVKPLFGSEGKGVERLTNSEHAQQVFIACESAGNVIYLQEFIPHPGWDLRVLVLGGRVLTAMRRHAVDGWRTNIALGGRGEAITLTDDEQRLALDAAKAVGCPIAGVDLLPGPNGYQVIEVNAVPGWKGLAAATGVDVAGHVIEHIVELAR
jgi:ribosomal protein S6--L-glutamate ligase